MTRLIDLRPEWYQIMKDFTPETGGWPTGEFSLAFVCPKCGPPYKILINLKLGDRRENPRTWSMNISPNGPDWPNQLTITPSINNSTHGRKHTCGFHGNIINGEVING